jgi:Tfp pilus assembly protein PilV
MAVIRMLNRGGSTFRHPQAGFTLIEMLIAACVLIVGLMGGMALIITAMANNNRSKMDSTATVLSQMTIEGIASVPANSNSSVTITDCNTSGTSTSHTISTTATSLGAGAPLTSSGKIDFTQSTVSGYSMIFVACQASTGDRQASYDVRWNIKALSSNAKLVAVSAREIGGPTHANFFAVPVTLKMIVGL